MINWRAFDHVSFAILCFLVMLNFIAHRPVGDAVMVAVTGMVWTIYHSYGFSKQPDYRIGPTAKAIAVSLYALSAIGTLYLVLVRIG